MGQKGEEGLITGEVGGDQENGGQSRLRGSGFIGRQPLDPDLEWVLKKETDNLRAQHVRHLQSLRNKGDATDASPIEEREGI